MQSVWTPTVRLDAVTVFTSRGSSNGTATCWEWPLLHEQWEMCSASSSGGMSVRISVTVDCTCPWPHHGKCLKQRAAWGRPQCFRFLNMVSHRWFLFLFYDEQFWLTKVTSLERESVSALIMKCGKAQFRWREWCNHWFGKVPYQNWIYMVFQAWLNSFHWAKEKFVAVVKVPYRRGICGRWRQMIIEKWVLWFT